MGLLGKVSEGWLVLITGPFTCPLGSILIPLNLILENHLLPGSFCCRKRDPFQGLRVGSCLTLGNELSKDRYKMTKKKKKKRPYWEGVPGEGSRVRETRRTALPRGSQPQAVLFVCFIVMGLVSGLSLASYLASHTFGLTQGPFWW